MAFRKPRNITFEPIQRVPRETRVINDPFGDEPSVTVDVDPYEALPDASLTDLKTLLKAGVNIKDVDTQIFAGGGISLSAAAEPEDELEKKEAE